MKQSRRNPFAYWCAALLGALNGFLFGYLCELANRIRFNSFLRELERIADEGGPIVDVWYPWVWWTLPITFLGIFAIACLFIYWLRFNRSLSIVRLWQEIGFVSVMLFLFPMVLYYRWAGWTFGFTFVGEVLFLLGLAFALNSIFGGILQILSNHFVRSPKNLFPKDAG